MEALMPTTPIPLNRRVKQTARMRSIRLSERDAVLAAIKDSAIMLGSHGPSHQPLFRIVPSTTTTKDVDAAAAFAATAAAAAQDAAAATTPAAAIAACADAAKAAASASALLSAAASAIKIISNSSTSASASASAAAARVAELTTEYIARSSDENDSYDEDF